MAKKKDKQFKHHKIYRWIALFAKLLAGPLFTYVFSNLTMLMPSQNQTVGTFLSTTLTLVVYYGIIFCLNRYKNFEERPPLAKPLAVYILVVIIFMSLESTFAGTIQNSLYYVTGLGYDKIISASTVASQLIYYLLGLLVHFIFGYITGIILFLLFKNVLTKEDKLAKI